MSDVQKHISEKKDAISLSPSALRHFSSILAAKPGALGVLLSVKTTGCSGLSYVMDILEAPKEDAVIQPLTGEWVLAVDRAAYPWLRGVHIDYVRDGLNTRLVYENPNQTGQCGCGESFTVDTLSKNA